MADPTQQTILRAIAASSSSSFSAADREQSFRVLQDLKSYQGRIPIVLEWLASERHVYEEHDITTATKLLGLEIVSTFLQKEYKTIAETNDRLQLRAGLLRASALVARSPMNAENRILAKKLAVLVEGLVLREFPQRWTTFIEDVFSPQAKNGLWYNEPGDAATQNLGVRICLEILKLIAEDCTDSDFNSKISTQRRNDVLIGLNEVSNQFMPMLYQILEHYPILQECHERLFTMHNYLSSSNRSVRDLSTDESGQYHAERKRRDHTAQLINDCLLTLEAFSFSMPIDWIMGESHDFLTALLYMIREPEGEIQLRAIACIEQLALRGKFSYEQWLRFITDLPRAISDANAWFSKVQEYIVAERRAYKDQSEFDGVAAQLEFHKAVSRLLATMISSHLHHMTATKSTLQKEGDEYQKLHAYILTMVEFLKHPSGNVVSEQLSTWISLLRDPQLLKAHFLLPYSPTVLSAHIDHLVRIRWEDVEDEIYPQHALFSKAFEDDEEYEAWQSDLRSKASLLFKLLGNADPLASCRVMDEKVQNLLRSYGTGTVRDHLAENGQLTQKSDAVIHLEALVQPLDNVLNGLPDWVFSERNEAPKHQPNVSEIRAGVQSYLRDLAQSVTAWDPKDLWLRFRKAQLIESMKHYWSKCESSESSSTLLQCIDALLKYLALPDEWKNGPSIDSIISAEIVGLKKKSGVALVSVSKLVPSRLVPWLSQLSSATSTLLSSQGLIPTNQMHLYEFLTCVATAIQDSGARSKFIEDVLAGSIAALISPENQRKVANVSALLALVGVDQAVSSQQNLTDEVFVDNITKQYMAIFVSLNRLLSVGKRCNEVSRKTTLVGGVSLEYLDKHMADPDALSQSFPDEGPLTLEQLAIGDPFSLLWPRFLPFVLSVYDSILGVWRPETQSVLLANAFQRFALAISDDEAYLSRKQEGHSGGGGVFGEGGTAGSIIPGTDRREKNLVPKWSGWLNELRNTCFQLIGLMAAGRNMYAPELAPLYPKIVSSLTDPANLKSMEHRHFVQFIKHDIEMMLLCTPASLYKSHLAPILGPVVEHIRYRIELSWKPVLDQEGQTRARMTSALFSTDTSNAASLAQKGGEEWFAWYYAHSGLYVGDLDNATAEAAVEKYRVDATRAVLDAFQVALALKGDWSLVLANIARAESVKRDENKVLNGNRLLPSNSNVELNADGTPKSKYSVAIDARKLNRINGLCHFLLLEDEKIAGNFVTTIVGCLRYPDAYTCRRTTKICHRILETVAWSPQYSQILGEQMFIQAIRNVVTEPKWMVGIEWDMINVIRDIYCRLVLGQILQFGGQGAAQQQNISPTNPNMYEQAKTVDEPLNGGGILVSPSDYPRRVLMSLPGISQADVQEFESRMKEKISAKDQKEFIKDLLRIAAENIKDSLPSTENQGDFSAFDRAVDGESLLLSSKQPLVPALPEKLVVRSQVEKSQMPGEQPDGPSGLYAFNFS